MYNIHHLFILLFINFARIDQSTPTVTQNIRGTYLRRTTIYNFGIIVALTLSIGVQLPNFSIVILYCIRDNKSMPKFEK